MKLQVWFAGVTLILVAAAPVRAGGAGPLELRAMRGTVEIKPLQPTEYWWTTPGIRTWPRGRQRLKIGKWQPARAGDLVGTFLLRTGMRSWVHLQGKSFCVDPNSLLRIESAADYGIQVLRGRVSAADGKRGNATLVTTFAEDSTIQGATLTERYEAPACAIVANHAK